MWALLISVVAHAVLLVQDGFPTPRSRLAQPLMATLRSIEINADTSPKTLVPGPPLPAARSKPVVHKRVAVAPIGSGDLQTQQQAVTSPGQTAPSNAVAAVSSSESAPGVNGNASPEDGLDPDGLRAYRVALASELRRFKNYPPRAVEAGWTGTAEISLSINAIGNVQTVLLTKTSGYRVLDEKALDMMRHAAPRTAIPGTLRGQPFSTKLPIAFTLDDE